MPSALPPPPPRKPAASPAKIALLAGLGLIILVALIMYARRPPPAAPPEKLPLIAQDGGYRYELTPTPYPLLQGMTATLDLHLFFKDAPIDEAVVYAVAYAPGGGTETRLDLKGYGNGGYGVAFPVDRAGEWNLSITFIHGGTQRSTGFTLKARE